MLYMLKVKQLKLLHCNLEVAAHRQEQLKPCCVLPKGIQKSYWKLMTNNSD